MDVRRACRVLQQLIPPALEVLITMGGCTHDVVNAVKAGPSDARRVIGRSSRV
jgi:hypothetical protein